jgi:hypothetical protein
VQGQVLLFDEAQGHVVAVLEGVDLTAWKTAGDSALGASCLAREDVLHHADGGRRLDGAAADRGAPLGAAVDRSRDDLEPPSRRAPRNWTGLPLHARRHRVEVVSDLDAALAAPG